MSNLARLNGGMKPIGVLRRANVYQSAGAVYPGDPVSLTSAGQVQSAAASSALVGVALSYASASGLDVMVADHPDQEFSIECSVSGGVASQTAMNLNYNIVSGSPNTTYKLSGATLDDSSGVASTSTLPLKALRLEKRDNNAFGINADVIVIINNHSLKGGTGTVGI